MGRQRELFGTEAQDSQSHSELRQGSLRRKTKRSAYAASQVVAPHHPVVERMQRYGVASEVRERLIVLLAAVQRGGKLKSHFVDGTVLGWRLRMVLSAACDAPADTWCDDRLRTQSERIAAVAKALAWFDEVPSPSPRRGGWSVSR